MDTNHKSSECDQIKFIIEIVKGSLNMKSQASIISMKFFWIGKDILALNFMENQKINWKRFTKFATEILMKFLLLLWKGVYLYQYINEWP